MMSFMAMTCIVREKEGGKNLVSSKPIILPEQKGIL